MKGLRWPKLRLYSFLFSMPFITVMLQLVMFEDRLWEEPLIWLLSSPLIFALGILSMDAHTRYDLWIEKKYPSLTQTRQRIMSKALVTLFVMTPSVYLIFLLYHVFHILNYQLESQHLWQGALVGLCVNLVFEPLYETDYIFRKYKESASGKEMLHQRSLKQEFDTLKNQVNPHFLFNCFNTLSSLISLEKERAIRFLDELSKVYRYLLKNNRETLSTLADELQFIESYFQLLQTRYESAIELHISIDKQYFSYYLPSLTLQLTVENAVKHNAISRNSPLVIEVFTAGENKLVVNNNLQRKTTLVPTNGVGLQNIKAKYQLLQQPGFQVMEGPKNFTVVLPLLWKP
ncbi:sensor histidine kinase [Niabella drilacis]|uniref:Histidine kinase n=1 Tax=Niabella drilacis (strain DSM 25811 / CCM 8410 / CCUG 62505 / LMG 26954 / E90) TaxID=1285928 RepID=A0A1G6Z6V9_NIADE|nr:histidine kinase [Niabella drilacis]SDD98409.1 Histidine kinase [Niabella drilacis]